MEYLKLLQFSCNSQYFINTIEESIDDKYANNQKSENNKKYLSEAHNHNKDIYNEDSNFRKNHIKRNLEINNYINQSSFTSPKDIMSTKSTNQNNLNYIKNEFNSDGNGINSLKNPNQNIKLNNDDNQSIDRKHLKNVNNYFKNNQVINAREETLNLDIDFENFQNYTNINSENGPNNINSSKINKNNNF